MKYKDKTIYRSKSKINKNYFKKIKTNKQVIKISKNKL